MTQSVDLELDHLARELTQHLERALIAARRAAQSRAAQQQMARRNAAAGALDRQTRELVTSYPVEALAARWAAADAVREQDPVAAQAWDHRVTTAGVDLQKVLNHSQVPGTDPSSVGVETAVVGTAGASDLVTEHLAEVYTDTALHPDAPAPAPTVANLLDAAHPDGVGAAPSTREATTIPAAEFHTAQGLDTDQTQTLGIDAGLDR
jgi:hypothetical protein